MIERTLKSWYPVFSSCRNLKRWKAAFICRNRKRRDGTVVVFLLSKTVLFSSEGICKKQPYLTRVCNHYPLMTLQIAGLRIYNGKSVIVKSWKTVRGKKTMVPSVEKWETVECLLERNIIHFGYFFQQHQTCQVQLNIFDLPIQWV